jgi:hypothetical protein
MTEQGQDALLKVLIQEVHGVLNQHLARGKVY